MAWRIHDNVQRGEIDNRERGRVRGRLWLCGMPEPVVLELAGNAAADLAGCLLTFVNPGEPVSMKPEACLNLLQQGTIGDLTASRKVRVLEMPVAEAYLRRKKGLPVPEHMANSIYLEWFSQANGRVVIEATDYQLNISPPAWRLSGEEERQRQDCAAEGFAGFMGKLSRAIEASKHKPPEDAEWDEFDYEKFLRESDARTDKYAELLDKYMDHPDRDRIISREMGWTWLEEAWTKEEETGRALERDGGDDAMADAETEDEGGEAENQGGLEAGPEFPPLEPDPLTEGVDWIRDEDGDISHPLSVRVFNSSLALWESCRELGLEERDDEDLGSLVTEYQITSAKLAGALDNLAYGREMTSRGLVVASLKRALSHVHNAQAALEKVAPKHLLPGDTLTATRAELFSVREEILKLMREFRGRAPGAEE